MQCMCTHCWLLIWQHVVGIQQPLWTRERGHAQTHNPSATPAHSPASAYNHATHSASVHDTLCPSQQGHVRPGTRTRTRNANAAAHQQENTPTPRAHIQQTCLTHTSCSTEGDWTTATHTCTLCSLTQIEKSLLTLPPATRTPTTRPRPNSMLKMLPLGPSPSRLSSSSSTPLSQMM